MFKQPKCYIKNGGCAAAVTDKGYYWEEDEHLYGCLLYTSDAADER